jgi:hypothetical protein
MYLFQECKAAQTGDFAVVSFAFQRKLEGRTKTPWSQTTNERNNKSKGLKMVRLMVCLDSSEDAHKVFEHCLTVVGRRAKAEHEVVLVGVAEVYHRSNILNVLRVDFDCQILDKANKSIIKGTTGACRVRVVSCRVVCGFL